MPIYASPSHAAPSRSNANRRRITAGSGLVVLGFGLLCLTPATSATTSDAGATLERTLKDPSIVESSGLARSRYSDTRLWTHNDSGGGTTLFAVAASGRTKARFELTGASHKDWEGMASAKRNGVSYLFVGDIGDNGSKRTSIHVHRVREPKPRASDRSLSPISYTFRYPDGPHNAETLLVKPRSLRIYVVTKGKQEPGAIYAAPKSPSARQINVLRKVGPAPAGMADGVFLDRTSFVLRGYESGWLYRNLDADPKRFRLPIKGESITSAWSKNYVLVGSEGRYSAVWRVRLP